MQPATQVCLCVPFRLGEQVSTSVTTFLEEAKSYITTLGQTVEAALSSAFQTIQPHFEGLAQAFQR